MKRLLPAVICIAAALWLCVGSYCYIKEQTAALCAMADKVLLNDERVFEAADEMCRRWDDIRGNFGALLKHSDADEFSKYFLMIRAHRASEDREALLTATRECRTALKVMLEGEKLSPGNIF